MSVWCLNGLMRRSKQHLCLFKTLRRNEAILAEPMLALTSEQRIDGNSRQSPDTASRLARKPMLKYQTIESYAPLATMSELIAF